SSGRAAAKRQVALDHQRMSHDRKKPNAAHTIPHPIILAIRVRRGTGTLFSSRWSLRTTSSNCLLRLLDDVRSSSTLGFVASSGHSQLSLAPLSKRTDNTTNALLSNATCISSPTHLLCRDFDERRTTTALAALIA